MHLRTILSCMSVAFFIANGSTSHKDVEPCTLVYIIVTSPFGTSIPALKCCSRSPLERERVCRELRESPSLSLDPSSLRSEISLAFLAPLPASPASLPLFRLPRNV